MSKELHLRRKYVFKVKNRKMVLVKRSVESQEHVYAKILAYALYNDRYPHAVIETGVDDKYKPDITQTDLSGRPELWIECGHVSTAKIKHVLKKFRNTHIVFVKFGSNIKVFSGIVAKYLKEFTRRTASVEIVGLPEYMDNYISENGEVSISLSDCAVIKFDKGKDAR